jgi:HD-like signal output (HDOD) protein
MAALPTFEELLPAQEDPRKIEIRAELIKILRSKGEILPSANSPRGKLWHLVNSPDSSLQECAEVIQLDSALASRIFRVANSGAYGMQAANITEAILHLGFKFVREQVFSAGVFKQYAGWVLPPEWDLFWLRNIFVARLTDRIAGAYEYPNGSEYLSGLLHDMGWLFLATYFPNEFTQIFTCAKPVSEAEIEFLPFGHEDISAAIAARSMLPVRAVNAVLYHHKPLSVTVGGGAELYKGANLLSVVLNLSDKIADTQGMNMFGPCYWTLETLDQCPEVVWLGQFGKQHDFALIAQEELTKSNEIFEAYFSNRKFQ